MTSGGAQNSRRGFIIRLDGAGGLFGLGEIAPLDAQILGQIGNCLNLLKRQIEAMELEEMPQAARRIDCSPAARAAIACGLDIAGCDVLAKAAGIPVAELLGGGHRPTVPVNATIGADDPELASRLARRALEHGFKCVKLKVGMHHALDAECALVGAVRDAIGASTRLRLDANQAWDVDTAVQRTRELDRRFELELVEQPVAADNIAGMARVRALAGVAIAADEAVTSVESARMIIEAGAADVLVIKPMVVGGIRPALEIIRIAAAMGAESVVTTTIDSGIGNAAALHLAAAFEGKLACGLATAELLECDLTTGLPQPDCGLMECGGGPGLGVDIDELRAAPYLDRS